MILLPFVKYQRAGNDFVLIDGRNSVLPLDLVLLSRYVCDRRKGIGADGLLILRDSALADCGLQIFNADGSSPAMCGNGAYCAVDHLVRGRSDQERWVLETPHAVLTSYQVKGLRVLNLGPVAVGHFPILLENLSIYVVNTGVPHAVVFVNSLHSVDVNHLGRQIRYHPAFAPEGVNVNFVCSKAVLCGKVCMRTYERGVEGETLACGTGAAAVAFVARALYGLSDPIAIFSRRNFSTVLPEYDSHLTFSFVKNENGIEEMEMGGDAHVVFRGCLEIPLFSQ